jgi:peptidoglycan/xylan/chitin deacetylase (PgdA/CDA1 family)
MHLDRGPFSAAYLAHAPAGDLGSITSRVDVHRRGVAVGTARVRFGDDATAHAFDSLELPVGTVDAAGGKVLVAIESAEVSGPLVVSRGGRVETGFPFFDWEARCLDESYVDLSQPLYSQLPVSYAVVPFMARAALLRVAGAVRKHLVPKRTANPGATGPSFPEYPVCGVVDRVRSEILRGLSLGTSTRPRGTIVLTHDMDELSAHPGVEKLRVIERRHGMTSAWGILSEKYRLPREAVDALVAEGCEVFSHGYLHDGRLPYLPREEQLRRLRHFFEAYPSLEGHTRGFRCGQLARSRSLYSAVQQVFDYDLTPPTTERGGPYGARSGVSTVFPFWNESGLLHLPLTLPQDYFLAFVERLSGPEIADRWIAAAKDVLALGGVGVHLVHPDNVLRSPAILDAYDRFLGWVRGEGVEVQLPGEVARSLGARPAARAA